MGKVLHELLKCCLRFHLYTQPIEKSTVVLLQGFVTYADYSIIGGKLIIYRKKNPTVGLGEEKPYKLP